MSTKTTRTVYGAIAQACALLGIDTLQLDNSTLNQKLEILADQVPNEGEVAKLSYVCIGIGGVVSAIGVNNVSITKPAYHNVDDAAMFVQVPYVLREIDNDLTALERANYRLRRIEVHSGITYYAYYGRIFDKSQAVISVELRTNSNGTIDAVPFTPGTSQQNPTPIVLQTNQVIAASSDYYVVSVKVPFVMTTADVEEFKNVCEIIYGDALYAKISEVAYCTGVDRLTTGASNGASINYMEVIDCQVHNFAPTEIPVYHMTEVNIPLDIGTNDPVLMAHTQQ